MSRPVSVEQLRDLAVAYLFGDSMRQIVDAFAENDPRFSMSTLHSRLQLIRRRTGKHTNVEACQAMRDFPDRYRIDRPDFEPTIERRARMRRQGLRNAEIARQEGVSHQAITEHFKRHPVASGDTRARP